MAPTLSAVVQQQTRVQLVLTWSGIQTATIQRLDPDGVLRNVRNAEPVVCLGACVAYDHEAPLDRAVTYQATSPDGTGTVLSDAFARTVSGGWGNADTGQTWTLNQGSGAYSVSGGFGLIGPATAATTYSAAVSNIGGADVDVTVFFKPGLVASGAQLEQRLRIRHNGTTYYETLLQYQTGGTIDLYMTRTGTNISALGSVMTYTSSTLIGVRLQAVGSTIRHRIWDASGIQPTTWRATVTDTNIPGATTDSVMLAADRITGNTQTGWAASFDGLTVNSLVPLTVTSNSVTSPSGGQAWLTHPGHPQYAGTVVVRPDGLTEARPARRGVFSPIGASLPVVVNDVRGGSTGTVTVQTSSAADITRLRNMLADGFPLLLRQPASWGGDSWWISIGDVGIDRFTQIATDSWRRWALPYQRVDRPPGTSDGPVGQTYNDLKATGLTYDALKATGKTYAQLSQSIT